MIFSVYTVEKSKENKLSGVGMYANSINNQYKLKHLTGSSIRLLTWHVIGNIHVDYHVSEQNRIEQYLVLSKNKENLFTAWCFLSDFLRHVEFSKCTLCNISCNISLVR